MSAVSSLPDISQSKRKPNVNSSVATFRKNGELFAVTHTHAATGYKSQPAQSQRFEGTSTYKASFQNRGSDPHSKVLQPYAAHAPRNTMPVTFAGETKPKVKGGLPKKGDNPLARETSSDNARFVTTNQRTYVEHKGTPVGFSNQGIVSEQTKWTHRRVQD